MPQLNHNIIVEPTSTESQALQFGFTIPLATLLACTSEIPKDVLERIEKGKDNLGTVKARCAQSRTLLSQQKQSEFMSKYAEYQDAVFFGTPEGYKGWVDGVLDVYKKYNARLEKLQDEETNATETYIQALEAIVPHTFR